MSGRITEDTPKLKCRFVGGPEDGVEFTIQGSIPRRISTNPGGKYHATQGTDGYDIDYEWTRHMRITTDGN